MLIFFQQLCLLLFLWLLKLVDGLMEIFSAISGITDVTYKGEKVNIIEFLAGDSTVNTIFWCIFILAIGLTCIFIDEYSLRAGYWVLIPCFVYLIWFAVYGHKINYWRKPKTIKL